MRKITGILLLLMLAFTLILVTTACSGKNNTEDTTSSADTTTSSDDTSAVQTTVGDTVTTPAESSSEELTTKEDTTAEETTAIDKTTAEETTEEVTTEEVTTEPPVLEWEKYDPSLDISDVDKTEEHKTDPTKWVAVDNLGRTLPTYEEVGPEDESKTLALFYWTWHGDFARKTRAYNIQQILDRFDSVDEGEEYLWSNATQSGAYHFWNEPIWGYYDGRDKWVIRKQVELLAAAGVDVIFFDNTNGSFTWLETVVPLLEVFREAKDSGIDVPKVSFMLPFGPNAGGGQQLNELYNKVFTDEKYEDLFYILDGKPMVMGYPDSIMTEEVRNYFTFRNNVGGYTDTQSTPGNNQWGWLSVFPQALFYAKDKTLEQMTVGVAINHNFVTHQISPMNHDNSMGRSYTSRGYSLIQNASLYGFCFAEQFENAIAANPGTIFVTGWNEWVAMKLPEWPGTSYKKAFVDEYNDEYSRDLEPSTGFLKDNYYYQFVSYVRQYKGAAAAEAASPAKLIDVNGGYGQWNNVTPVYNDYYGMTDRNMTGYRDTDTGGVVKYENNTARNDIYDAKVARDYEYVYFMVRTVDDLTPYTDNYWMRLYIDTDSSDKASWESFEYIINRTSPKSENKTTLERFTGKGFETEVVCEVEYSVRGNVLMVKVPKSALGIEDYNFEFSFKWTDNTQENGDIMAWYSNGDVAPVGRFKYRYTTTGDAEYVEVHKPVGQSLMDFTDKATRDSADDIIDSAVDGMTYELTEDGLVLNASAENSGIIFKYDTSSPRLTAENFGTIIITYKTTDAGATSVYACGAAGKFKKSKLTSTDITAELVSDGAEHTVTLVLDERSTFKYNYINYVKIGLNAPGTVTVTSVELVPSGD